MLLLNILIEVKLMKILHTIVLLLGHLAIIFAANLTTNTAALSQNSVTVSTDSHSEQTQSTTISLDRSDLSQPHILRVKGSSNMERVNVKINGKSVKSIVNGALELNLAPMMTAGHYEVDISGTSARSDDTVSVTFTGKNTNITQQSSGNRNLNQKLVINVQ
jgi:CCR4-NOT transcriptional regulation complex NOT5 subunit